MKSPERVAEAQRMRAEGYSLKVIAQSFWVSESTISGWINDPDPSEQRDCETCSAPITEKRRTRRRFCSDRCRRQQYAGACIDCGGPTDGHDGPGKASKRCTACAHEASRQWTPDAIVDALRSWTAEHGHPPSARSWRTAGTEAGIRPPSSTAQRVFGSWAAAMEAAGLESNKPGPRRKVAA